LPAAAITVAGRLGGPNFPASARAAALSRSIDMWKWRMPAARAGSVSAIMSAVPTPWRCQPSTTSIATSATSNSSSRTYRAIPIGARGGGENAISASWCQWSTSSRMLSSRGASSGLALK
jgi:hypothetical protein